MRFAASVDAILKHQENTQWWPADILRRHQFELLKPLVAHAYQTVPWYRRKFDECGVQPDRCADELPWPSVPLLTRRDIQSAGNLLYSAAVPASHGQVSQKSTSGSTATPVMVLRTELTGRFWIANTLREYRWQELDLTAKLAAIRALPSGQGQPAVGVQQPTWGIATAGRVKTGMCVGLDVRSPLAEQAKWLLREQPRYLQTYPSIVFELANYFLDRAWQLRSLERVLTFGEILEPRVRAVCRRAWQSEILDSYSASEVGYVAGQCAAGSDYHVHADHLLVEVLDDSGRECNPGECGRVVITDLFNYAMPLLRYEIGDYAEVGGSCPCGRMFPTLRRVLGRQRNMLVLPSGEKRWPVLEVEDLSTFEGNLPIRQFQAVQHTRSDLEVKLVVDRRLTAQEEAGLRTAAVQWLGEELPIRFSYVDAIPRGASGKFEDFRCEIGADS